MKDILLEEKFLLDDISEILYESFPPILADSGLSMDYKRYFAKEFNIGNNSKQKRISIENIFNKEYEDGLRLIINKDNLDIRLWIAGNRYGTKGEKYKDSSNITSVNKSRILKNYPEDMYNAYYITMDPHSVEQEDIRTERGDAVKIKTLKLSNKHLGIDKYGDRISHLRNRQYSIFPEKETVEQVRKRLKNYKSIVEKRLKELIQKYERMYIENELNIWKKNIKDFNFGGINIKKIPDKEKMKELEKKAMDNVGVKLNMPNSISIILNKIDEVKETYRKVIAHINNVIGYKDLEEILKELNDKEHGIFRDMKDFTSYIEKEINRLEKK